jgi:hypothetical protein
MTIRSRWNHCGFKWHKMPPCRNRILRDTRQKKRHKFCRYQYGVCLWRFTFCLHIYSSLGFSHVSSQKEKAEPKKALPRPLENRFHIRPISGRTRNHFKWYIKKRDQNIIRMPALCPKPHRRLPLLGQAPRCR